MSIQTIYKCDKCHAEQPTIDQFWEVGVSAQCLSSQSLSGPRYVSSKHSMHVCRSCLESLGIHVRAEPGKVAPPAPTLEDLIREIVRQEQAP